MPRSDAARSAVPDPIPLMSASSLSDPSGASAPRSWRAILFWAVFALTLVTGLVLAVRFGASAPDLLDVVRE